MAAGETTKWTYEDLEVLPADGKRHEIIDGEHYVNPAPNLRHQRIVMNLGAAIYNFLKTHPIGEVWAAPVDVVFSEFDTVKPDVVYVSNERSKIMSGGKNLQGAPDLVVEVISPSSRKMDEITKRKLYSQFGVSEYWVIDPELETVKIYRGSTRMEMSNDANDILTTPLLPGLEIPLAEIFE